MTATKSASRTFSIASLCCVALVFVVSRAIVVWPHQDGDSATDDVRIYADWIQEYERQARQGLSLEKGHAEEAQARFSALRAAGRPLPPMDMYVYLPYPPLALEFFRLPLLWIRGRSAGDVFAPHFGPDYAVAYERLGGVIDALLCVLVVALVGRLYRHEPAAMRLARALTYPIITLPLWHILCSRLDMPLAALLALSFWLLTGPPHWFWSFVVLAVAVNLKVVPAVLLPIWVVAAMPAALGRSWGSILAGLGLRTGVLLGLIVACFLPFYLRSGEWALGFFHYNESRGFEVLSSYSSVLTGLAHWFPLEVYQSHLSANVRSEISPTLLKVVPWLAGALLGAALLLFLVHARRLAQAAGSSPRSETLAQRYPTDIAGYTLFFLMVFIAVNKVGSPHYFIWTAPFVPLVPLRRRAWWAFVGVYLFMLGLTSLIYPYLFFSDMFGPSKGPEPVLGQMVFQGPSLRGALLLGARNALLIGLAAAFAVYLFRHRGRPILVDAGTEKVKS